ncbi:MAG: NAD(P)/FAD-dependent oxidoreductase [Alphaproteobacteria bacterium]|nr:MAG: NAD(P)/FAD-dependent oxidoreductase [Alphaproteobacteria bacterium]
MTEENAGLARLEAELARDFERLNHPPDNWVPERPGPDGQPLIDVLIAGAGMNGAAAAFALRRQGIARIAQIDRAEPGRTGPWRSFARMELLRSPKHLTGPAGDIANLSFRAWWEAQHGAEGWAALGYISRTDWADYLDWYARVTGARVEYRCALVALEPGPDHVAAYLSGAQGARTVHARQVVLATGREGQARPRWPAELSALPRNRVAHSSEAIDFAALKGRRVAVIGLAASAFDNAAMAAEAGAEVTLIGRAREVPRINRMKATVFPGTSHGFVDLAPAERLAWLRHITASRIAPPGHTVRRVARAGVRLVTGAALRGARMQGDAILLETAAGRYEADFVILGTGFAFDLSAAPELAGFVEKIRLWRHVEGVGRDDEFLACPFLGPGFEFLPVPGADCPGLGRIRCYTHAAQPNLGNLANDIPQAGEGAGRLARAIVRALFVEDRAAHWQRIVDYDEPEVIPDDWPGVL